MKLKSAIRADIENMCTVLGANPLLVQGAGVEMFRGRKRTHYGVKASGTWLSDASV